MQGVEFSGMSKNSVPPPAASARLPVARAFPLGAAGLVEMHVDVDQAREDGEAARVDFLAAPPGSSGPMAVMTPSSMAMSARTTPPR